ncbi:Target of rapamycin complex 2 subunit bit61, partial [Lachnellula arida]
MSQLPPPTGHRAPGSFSPVVPLSISTTTTTTPSARPPLRKVHSSSSSEDSNLPSVSVSKQRVQQNVNLPAPPRPLYAVPQANSSTGSLQNFSRPTPRGDLSQRNGSPLTTTAPKFPLSSDHRAGHRRNNSHTQGSFEPYLPTAATSNLGSMANLNTGLNASQIAAQAAMQHQSHNRQRSQTVPTNVETASHSSGNRRPSNGPTSPPLLSLTEASAPRESNLGGQVYRNGLLAGGNQSAAQAAANVVFPKSPPLPGHTPEFEQQRMQQDKPTKTEKSKVKLFSRPGKINVSKDREARVGALPSPSKMAQYTMASLQRNNPSTNSLADNMSMSSAASMYSMANSSSATIRAVDSSQGSEKESSKDKEKHKHHFLSRQKHKLSSKDDHHLPLSSAASNSRPADPSAPSSLYNFNLPPSPGPTTTSFAKSMSGLDLRHGGRALREKKKEEKSDALRESELSYQNNNEWLGPASMGSAGAASFGAASYPSSIYGGETAELKTYGLNNMGPDDAWPFLKAKLLIIFEGEDLRLPVEDFNRLVTIHLQRCIQKRAPNVIIEDLRDLLATGFSSLDQTLRKTPDERLIPHLVEMWLFTFTSVLPYMQAVFLPLDLEFSGHGPFMSPEIAQDFWGALPSSQALEVRRIVLIAYRDTVILPRFDTLKTIFSRLSLDSISLAIPPTDNLSTSPDSFSGGRPSTAMSLDPSHASYGSQTTTLLGGGSSGDGSGNRSRAISNVSYNSDPSSGMGIPPPQRPFTPSSTHPLNRGQREQKVEDSSKQLTETVGRMLQCMSVLASVGVGGGSNESSQKKMEELTRGL